MRRCLGRNLFLQAARRLYLARSNCRSQSRSGTQCRASRGIRSRTTSPGRAQHHVTTVINVPPSLDEHTMESVFEQLAPLPRDEKVVIDARHARWASPYGLTTLLCIGQSRESRADFTVPENSD